VKYSGLPKMVEGESVLLMDIKGLPEMQGYQLFESTKQILSGKNRIKFLPEQEYHLIQKGISKELLYGSQLSDSTLSLIAKETNCRYMLHVEVLNSKKGGAFGSYTPLELDQYNRHYYQESETNSASLLFRLVDTKDRPTENTFQVNTKINPLVINEDGGETRINPTTELSAITKAFEKGARQLKKGVVKEY